MKPRFIDEECADLNLFNARIGDDGAKALALAILHTDARIESINLRDNRISDEGAVALAAALASNEHVRSLQLRGNDIGDRGVTALAGALHTNTVLTGTFRVVLGAVRCQCRQRRLHSGRNS